MNPTDAVNEKYLGEIRTRLAGCQYVAGEVQPGDILHLERELDNPHDPNAILVRNPDFARVGYISREMARWIAPLIDRGALWLEAQVPADWNPDPFRRHAGFPAELKVYLTRQGFAILEPVENPATDIEALHETIREVFVKLDTYKNPDVIWGLSKRLEKMAVRDVAPETHLLLALFPAKAEVAKQSRTHSLIDIIREKISGLKLGEAIHYHNLTLFPLLPLNGSAAPFVLLKKALERKEAEIEEISEEGRVQELTVHNHGDKPVLVPEGEILVGAKQNRVVNVSVLVAAHQSLRIPVSCVERGRWHYSSRRFRSAYYAHPRLRSKKMRSVQECRIATGMALSDQGEVWEEVDQHLHEIHACSPTASVTDGYQQTEEKTQHFREKLALPDEAAGVLAGSGDEIIGMDFFHDAAVFKDCWDQLAGSYFTQAAFDPHRRPKTDPQTARNFLARISQSVNLCEPPIGLGHELMVKHHSIYGTGVWYEDALCHLAVFPVEQ
ncbi:MAG TPA: HIRAN domain-containing protein [bacterium]|nr:HIRAN domain-containing protein [bacterium]HOL93281.1 HIRAN domain-containing protein [bacterium]